jgi:uncharacterized membrane protein
MADSHSGSRSGSRSRSDAGGTASGRPLGAWLVIAALLAVGIAVPLLVPLYDSATPTLLGFPFYYWFQFAMIPVVSLLTYVAFRLSLVATRRDRRSLGMPGTPASSTDAEDGDGR